MLDLIKNMFKIVSARIQLFEQFYINYIIIALLSVALVCACVLIQYKITKYKKQTHLKVLVCNLINIICLYSSVLLFSYLTQLIPDFEICSDNMLLDSYIITLCIIWFYTAARFTIITPIITLLSLASKLISKIMFRNKCNANADTNETKGIHEICAEFTRVWIGKKVELYPDKSRHKLIVSNKTEYIEELCKLLPNNCNKSRVALYYHSYYCSLWK